MIRKLVQKARSVANKVLDHLAMIEGATGNPRDWLGLRKKNVYGVSKEDMVAFLRGEAKPAHKTVGDAIKETEAEINSIRGEVRERKKWLYLLTDLPEADVAKFFGRPEGTATRVGEDYLGRRMVAVWNDDSAKVPNTDPSF